VVVYITTVDVNDNINDWLYYGRQTYRQTDRRTYIIFIFFTWIAHRIQTKYAI